jgi:hypothetical protein
MGHQEVTTMPAMIEEALHECECNAPIATARFDEHAAAEDDAPAQPPSDQVFDWVVRTVCEPDAVLARATRAQAGRAAWRTLVHAF